MILLCLWGVDMELLGWIIWLIFSVCVTVSPFPYIAISALGGRLKKIEWLFLFAVFVVGLALTYHCIAARPFTVTVN
ncbi:hypothetical protein [Pseudoalteromonas phage H105/1]|uniref:hypothetical protein n=1 Tax=Pseudoalteromonas phage H105/1 TaxID=877240 RepID=UPI0001E439E2|nr:hypothetical protein AV949_gp31 [Pseudoalteromonas phage H105/1]ADM26691.1 hypothetical protein [Pseudoalteromonas phage H105/1]